MVGKNRVNLHVATLVLFTDSVGKLNQIQRNAVVMTLWCIPVLSNTVHYRINRGLVWVDMPKKSLELFITAQPKIMRCIIEKNGGQTKLINLRMYGINIVLVRIS